MSASPATTRETTQADYITAERERWAAEHGHPADHRATPPVERNDGQRPIRRLSLPALMIPAVADRFRKAVPAKYVETRLPALEWIVSCPDCGPTMVPFGEFVDCGCGRVFLRTETRVLVARP
jgi:hypothetical protein